MKNPNTEHFGLKVRIKRCASYSFLGCLHGAGRRVDCARVSAEIQGSELKAYGYSTSFKCASEDDPPDRNGRRSGIASGGSYVWAEPAEAGGSDGGPGNGPER